MREVSKLFEYELGELIAIQRIGRPSLQPATPA